MSKIVIERCPNAGARGRWVKEESSRFDIKWTDNFDEAMKLDSMNDVHDFFENSPNLPWLGMRVKKLQDLAA